MKRAKKHKEAHVKPSKRSSGDSHVSHTNMGMGDYYGMGVRQPLGRLRSDTVGFRASTPKQLKKPPKSLA